MVLTILIILCKRLLEHCHWRRSALDSAGALQSVGGEFRGILTLFYTINFRGLCKSGGARAPAAPPSSAPMHIYKNEKTSELQKLTNTNIEKKCTSRRF